MSQYQSISNVAIVSGFASGSNGNTVASGWAVVYDILAWPLSGNQPSFSGQSIRVMDAVSGMGAITSGQVLYNYGFGNHSGFSTPVASLPPQIHAMNATIFSGIVVAGASGWVTVVVYAK